MGDILNEEIKRKTHGYSSQYEVLVIEKGERCQRKVVKWWYREEQ